MEGKLIAWGAEAEVYAARLFGENVVVKRRVQKAYRIPEIDIPLRRARTRGEALLLHRAKLAGVSAPIVRHLGDYEIWMSVVKGRLLRDALPGLGARRARGVLEAAGRALARLHANGIIHGDFTPANIVVDGKGVTVIDFGLGGFSNKLEDKAVDLLLMKKGLADEKLFRAFLRGYARASEKANAALARMREVEKRGRYVVRGMAH
ncbi:MAG: KEOPS complex kinase/ATPase Bud32 [Candidatus Micrarchaeia archaeon]